MEKDKFIKIWVAPVNKKNNAIYDEKKILREVIGHAKPVKNPTIRIYCGIPGSGKSSIMKKYNKNAKNFVILNFDYLLFKYSNSIKDTTNMKIFNGDSKFLKYIKAHKIRFANPHAMEMAVNDEINRLIGDILIYLVEKKYNIAYEQVHINNILNMILYVKTLNYHISFYWVKANFNACIKRIKKRAEENGVWIVDIYGNTDIPRIRHFSIDQTNLVKYILNPKLIDEGWIVDNNAPSPKFTKIKN